jgi:hypothetical protein
MPRHAHSGLRKAFTLTALLALAAPLGARGAAPPTRAATPEVAAVAERIGQLAPWQWLAQLWHQLTAADTTPSTSPPTPTTDSGGVFDPNGTTTPPKP